MFVIHANWTAGYLNLWAESLEKFSPNTCIQSESSDLSTTGNAVAIAQKKATAHPYVVTSEELFRCFQDAQLELGPSEASSFILKLPHDLLEPWRKKYGKIELQA